MVVGFLSTTGHIVTEEGYSISQKEFWEFRESDFWNTGWSLWMPEQHTTISQTVK